MRVDSSSHYMSKTIFQIDKLKGFWEMLPIVYVIKTTIKTFIIEIKTLTLELLLSNLD